MNFIHIIFRNKIRIFFALGCFFVIAIVGIIVFRLYPAAIVNGHFITERRFEIATAAASHYYQKLTTVYTGEQGAPDLQTVSEAELKTGALDGIIEDELIFERLQKDFGNELSHLVNEKVASAATSPDLKKAAAAIYGISWEDFKGEVLISQARRDILTNGLFLKKEDIQTWLASERTSASVLLFVSGLEWNGSEVVSH